MPTRLWTATGFAILCGIPLYLLLDAVDLLSPAIRDRPWPLVALAAASAMVAVAAARHAPRRSARVCAGAALLSPAAVLIFAWATAARLPPQARELLLGGPLPDAALTSANGDKQTLSSLRGQPLVLVVYRGFS